MPCLNCGHPATIDAHLIPEAFIWEVTSAKGEQHLILHGGDVPAVVSNKGVYDREMLCEPCDGLLGRHEGYAIGLLRSLRKSQAAVGTLASVDPVDGDRMVRFAAGIAWKYGVTGQAGRIELGPYADVLRDVALRDGPIPPSIDLAMIRLVELDGDVYFYRTPMPDRKEDVNMIRFTVGSFLFFLKVDKRDPGPALPAGCWMRAKVRADYLMAAAGMFEEGRMHRTLGASPRSRSFFGKMRERRKPR